MSANSESTIVDLKKNKIDFKAVEVGIRSIDELGKDCAKLAKTKKHCGAPSLFRIALIGFRGSGCTTLAKYLAERFNLVHSTTFILQPILASRCSITRYEL